MSNTELLIVGAAVGGVAIYFIWQHQKKTNPPPAYAGAAAAAAPTTPGSAIAQFGGAALGQVGKDFGSWAGSQLADLFS